MKHIHIIGIGGTFMGGVAAIAKEAGYRVTGCDAKMYPPMSTQLAALGIDAVEGFHAEQLDDYPADMYVIGNVATRGMPVVEAVLNRGLSYTSGPQWLSENILQQYRVLAVAGTHGKTTTSGMLAWILESAGFAPGFLIGGVPQNFTVSARLGSNKANKKNQVRGLPDCDAGSQKPLFVIEADEYDTAFFDKRSKFVHYRPTVCILNNLEYDHADIFPDLAAIQTQFHHLMRTVPSEGLVVCNSEEAALQSVLDRGCWTPVVRFGSGPSSRWQAGEPDDRGYFEVFCDAAAVGTVCWSLAGKHNRMNALAAIAAAVFAGVPPSQACESLSLFQNVRRRMELKGTVAGIRVFDDFAHHPTAIATTIDGLKQQMHSKGRIIAVLEPRSNTMKQGALKDRLAESLNEADFVFCYSPGADWDVQAALAPLGKRAAVRDDLESMADEISACARAEDNILIMSNGGFGGIHEKVLARLGSRFPGNF